MKKFDLGKTKNLIKMRVYSKYQSAWDLVQKYLFDIIDIGITIIPIIQVIK